MKQERVILSFIMVLIGLLVAGATFYFYQSTKSIPQSKTNLTVSPTPTPTPKPSTFITLDQPADESVVGGKTLQISGKTNPNAIILVITDSDQQVVQPTGQGAFSTSITIGDGENVIRMEAITPDGGNASLQRTVTFSTQDF